MTIRVSLTYTDIHSHPLSIFPLPVCVFSDCGKVDDAVRAYQLCLHLLEPAGRDELRRLLAFMSTAAHPDACRLHKQVISLHTHHLKTIVSQIMGQGPMINTIDISSGPIIPCDCGCRFFASAKVVTLVVHCVTDHSICPDRQQGPGQQDISEGHRAE